MSTICRYSPPDVTGRCNLSGARKCKTCKGGSTMIFHQSGYSCVSHGLRNGLAFHTIERSNGAYYYQLTKASLCPARSPPRNLRDYIPLTLLSQLINFITNVCPIRMMLHTGRIWINGTLRTARNVYLVCLETFSALQSRPVVWKIHDNSLWSKHESVFQFQHRFPSG